MNTYFDLFLKNNKSFFNLYENHYVSKICKSFGVNFFIMIDCQKEYFENVGTFEKYII